LKPAEDAIESAKKEGARRYAPRTLASAESKMELAENIIETDRNNSSGIQDAVTAAKNEAQKLLDVTKIAKKNGASESVALELHSRRIANEKLSEEVNRTEAQVREERRESEEELRQEREQAESLLRKERAETERLEGEKTELEKKNQFNEAFAWAQKQFGPDEAEVYRQGDHLLIRLKNMNFKSGQTELPSSAFPVLAKVKDVIAKMGAEKVKVEGHTDSVGSKILNQTLSKARAENVAEFISSDKLIGKNQIEADGLGAEKPISSNKTKQGRAQNRRVDIILTPSQSADKTSEPAGEPNVQ
jgi:outer membrane protein OmpA-like peptidoglycan-associated protein